MVAHIGTTVVKRTIESKTFSLRNTRLHSVHLLVLDACLLQVKLTSSVSLMAYAYSKKYTY